MNGVHSLIWCSGFLWVIGATFYYWSLRTRLLRLISTTNGLVPIFVVPPSHHLFSRAQRPRCKCSFVPCRWHIRQGDPHVEDSSRRRRWVAERIHFPSTTRRYSTVECDKPLFICTWYENRVQKNSGTFTDTTFHWPICGRDLLHIYRFPKVSCTSIQKEDKR